MRLLPLLLCAQSSVLEPHLMAVAFPASCCIDMVLGAAPEAYLEVEPAVLGNLLFECISNWHLVRLSLLCSFCPLRNAANDGDRER